MASEWEYRKIADVAEKVACGPFGAAIKVSTFVPEGVPVISGQHLHGSRLQEEEYNYISDEHADRLKNANVFCGDVIFTAWGSIGQVAYIPNNSRYARYVVSQRQFYMRCDTERVLPAFVTYYFKTGEGQHRLTANSSPTGVPSIAQPVTYLKSLTIPVPPLKEQEAIVRILGTLDDKIELNRRMNENLEAIARAIFKSWFVDFDPVRAKVDGRQPMGMDAETATLFPDSFEDLELGRVPRGWSIRTIGSLAELNAWTLKKTDDLDPIEYVEISEVSHGTVAATQVFERGTEPSRARRRVRHGDTVLSTVRPDRRAYFLTLKPSLNLVVSTGFAVVSPTEAPWSLIYAALTQPAVSEYLGQLADGGAYPAVNPSVIDGWEIAWPSEPGIPEAFQDLCGSLYEHTDNNRNESSTLTEIRDTLLPKLISGEILVKDAEKFVEEHAG